MAKVLYDEDNRIIYFSDEINNDIVSEVCFQILKMITNDKQKPIHLFINSKGGNTDDAWSLADLILASDTPIYTYCTGYALSSGLLIFLAGKKRFASKHAYFLYHQIFFSTKHKYQDSVEYRQEMDFCQKDWEKFIQERTKISDVMLQEAKYRKKDWYIHMDEALELGIVTDIYEGELR